MKYNSENKTNPQRMDIENQFLCQINPKIQTFSKYSPIKDRIPFKDYYLAYKRSNTNLIKSNKRLI